MSDKKFIKWILTYGYRQAKRESDQGNLSIAGALVISQIVFWVAAIIFSPLFIFLYALGRIVKLLDRP